MQFTKAQIEALLYQSEGEALDFKRDQYEFSGNNDVKRSEILKDLLAFANSWRQSDAFILVGVEEVVGGRAVPVGISDHLQESNLQQFVNSKTNRRLEFEYQVVEFQGFKIGVFRIPVQQRPVYSEKVHGVVKANTVYYRQGSSICIATPEVIAQMGEARAESLLAQPIIDLEFADINSGESLGVGKSIDVTHLILPLEIADLDAGPFNFVDPNYYKHFAEYIRAKRSVSELHFRLENRGGTTIHGARLEVCIYRTDAHEYVIEEGEMPDKPESAILIRTLPTTRPLSGFSVTTFPDKFRACVDIGKLQPKETLILPDPLLMGSTSDVEAPLMALLFADNLSSPAMFHLKLKIRTFTEELTLEKLYEQADAED